MYSKVKRPIQNFFMFLKQLSLKLLSIPHERFQKEVFNFKFFIIYIKNLHFRHHISSRF